jgi:hypothetical protein
LRKLWSGSLVGLGLAILLAVPAAAGGSAPSDERLFVRGLVAYAFGGECRESADGRRVTCTDTSVNIFDGRRGGTEPEFRFRGEEVCVDRNSQTFNARTGRLIRHTFEHGCARNRASLDVDFGERLRWASVTGMVKLDRERCHLGSEDGVCESDQHRIAVDLYWDGHGPITERFIYVRETVRDCETTFSGTERSREAHVTGDVGARSVHMDGAILKVDLQQTRVCQ